MLFYILEQAGLEPSIISGAGLVSIIKEGKIGESKAENCIAASDSLTRC